MCLYVVPDLIKDVMKQTGKDVRNNAETRVLVENERNNHEETTSYWFDLPIDVAEFEEKQVSVQKVGITALSKRCCLMLMKFTNIQACISLTN